MDKLQPIIKYRFWILCGLMLPIAMYGYYSANGALKAATVDREKALDGVKSGIPSGTTEPNDKYAESLNKINEFLGKEVEEVIVGLWKKQTERMTWPSVMQEYVPKNFLSVEDGDTFSMDAGYVYQRNYDALLDKLMQRVEPVYPILLQDLVPQGQKQKVVLIPDVPRAKLNAIAVSPQEIWDAQIDIWLTSLVFDAVRNINADADAVSDAVVRRIETFYLFGGTGQPLVPGAAMGMEGGMMSGGEEGYSGDMMEAMSDMGTMGIGGATAIKSSVKFSPAEEFGPDVDSSAMASATGEEESTSGDAGYSGDMGMMGAMGMGGGPRLRYIADSPESPYLERGFYMSVIILQNKIPDFLIELANAPWPTRIVRFNIGENPFRPTDAGFGGGQLALGSFGGYGEYGGYGLGEPDYGLEYGDSQMETENYDSDYGGMAGFDDYGGFGAGMMGGATVTKGKYSNGLPKWATDAMANPDLVQLDLCGVITMYRQPESLKVPVETPAEATTDDGTTPQVPPSESAPAATPPADPATDAAPPAAPGDAPTPAGAPAAPPASEGAPAPAATEPPVPNEAAPPTAPANVPEAPTEPPTEAPGGNG